MADWVALLILICSFEDVHEMKHGKLLMLWAALLMVGHTLGKYKVEHGIYILIPFHLILGILLFVQEHAPWELYAAGAWSFAYSLILTLTFIDGCCKRKKENEEVVVIGEVVGVTTETPHESV
jgi:hypothetical protein